jgi:hypothetical protein
VGLTRGTTREHLVRAALEAMAYGTADVLEAMRGASGAPLDVLRVDGGATFNDWLMQFQADVLGVPVERPDVIETTAMGAAGLAGIAAGVWPGRGGVLRIAVVHEVRAGRRGERSAAGTRRMAAGGARNGRVGERPGSDRMPGLTLVLLAGSLSFGGPRREPSIDRWLGRDKLYHFAALRCDPFRDPQRPAGERTPIPGLPLGRPRGVTALGRLSRRSGGTTGPAGDASAKDLVADAAGTGAGAILMRQVAP